jgi:hypothetical protein
VVITGAVTPGSLGTGITTGLLGTGITGPLGAGVTVRVVTCEVASPDEFLNTASNR